MDSALNQQNNERSHRIGKRAATIGGVALAILLLIPIFFYQDPPPGQPGILVNLGLPDQGQGDENARSTVAQPSESEPEPPTPTEPEVVPPTPEPEPTPPQPQPDPEVVQQEDPSAVALREAREKAAREKAEADRKAREAERKAKAEADRKAREAAEAAARAEAERKAREDAANATKNQIGGLFGNGSGKGNTGTAGNQGDPNGDPNASAVSGISTGNGNVSGLGGRNIVSAPPVTGRTQDAGTVVVKICVDSNGKVVSADYTQSGSVGATPQLKQLALANAKKYKFSAGTLDKQCGRITYKFKVQ